MIKKILLILIPIIVILAIILIAFFWYAKKPFSGSSNQKTITVEAGDKTTDIATKLYSAEIINSRNLFIVYAYISGDYKHYQTGKFYLSPNKNIIEISTMLTEKPKDEIKITIPEGWRISQISEKLEELGITKQADFAVAAKSDEGYLFPDTYYFLKNTPATDIVAKMKNNFLAKTADLKIDDKTLIIASIVEREAKFDADRPIIAGIYYNRLSKNMKLEADPTIQYALGNWSPITAKDLNINSVYNTYKNAGLPPTPICNPGLPSIEAAASPATTNYLYFINSSDGKAYFATTPAEQAANIKKYLQ